LSLFSIYLFSLLGSGLLAAAISVICKFSNDKISFSLIIWLIIRLLSDSLAFLLILKFRLNNFPVFHVSILIEAILISNFFHGFFTSKVEFRILTYLIPVTIFILETQFLGSIFSANRISFMSYNLMTSILMFILIWNIKRINIFDQSIIKALFVFHSISFIYSISENVIRVNNDLMSLILPIFLVSIISLNLFLSYHLWSVRRS
jgi:hypothetical protein